MFSLHPLSSFSFCLKISLPSVGGSIAVDVYSFLSFYNPAFLMHLDYGDRPGFLVGSRNTQLPCFCSNVPYLYGFARFFVHHSTRKVVLVFK